MKSSRWEKLKRYFTKKRQHFFLTKSEKRAKEDADHLASTYSRHSLRYSDIEKGGSRKRRARRTRRN